MRATITALGAFAAAAASARAASAVDDNFADGVRGTQWSGLTDSPSTLALAEQSGRLELLASAPASANTDALYLSNFRLSTASSFSLRLDFSFTDFTGTGTAGSAMAVVFGVGRDVEGTDSAAIGQGFANSGFGALSLTTVGYRTDDVGVQPVTNLLTPTTGTFEIVYDAVGDDLTLSRLGGGTAYTLPDTVRGVWGAADLLVSFGGRGNGFSTASGQAFVDNFTVVTGSVVPEPACLTLLSVAGFALRRRRTK
jgi:hypothetical protein